jgi:hypothetical protein
VGEIEYFMPSKGSSFALTPRIVREGLLLTLPVSKPTTVLPALFIEGRIKITINVAAAATTIIEFNAMIFLKLILVGWRKIIFALIYTIVRRKALTG